MPHPKQAIGFFDVSYLTNRGFYIPKPIAESGIGLFYLFTVIAIIFAVLFSRYSKKKQELTGKEMKFLLEINVNLVGIVMVYQMSQLIQKLG